MSIESLFFIGLLVKGGQNLNLGKKPQGSQTSRGGKLLGRAQQAGKIASSAARAGAKNAVVGGASGYLAGAAQAEQQGKGPGGQIAAGLKKGAKGAMRRGTAAAKDAANQARFGNQTAKDIPTQDLRSQLGQAKNFADKANKLSQLNSPQGALNALKGLRNRSNMNKIPQGKNNDLRRHALKEQAKSMLKAKARQLAFANAGETFGLSVVAYYAVTHWRETIALVVALFLVFFMMFTGSTFDAQSPGDNTNTPPTTNDTCVPAQFTGDAYGKTSVCTITITDSGSATDITIVDNILQGTEFSQAFNNGVFDSTSNTVTWDAKNDNLPLNPVNIQVSVIIRITTHQKNLKVWNTYTITPTGLTGGSSGGTAGAGCGTFDKTATTFEALMSGQGRCTNVLGNESNFVSAVEKNGSSLGLSSKDSELHALYKEATAKNVNPLIVTTIWGVEASWQDNGTQFGCKPFGSGFTSQLSCSVNTLDHWMTYFEQQKTKPVAITSNCKYNDEFVYAYEKYTPVCTKNDSNGNARQNFVNYYKKLFGA